uniref:Fatty acid desaturase domain-containing protein n=1 Tax=Prymnesium polylepis TaxID=72548 RepID=A0A7S4MJ73_9EUKA
MAHRGAVQPMMVAAEPQATPALAVDGLTTMQSGLKGKALGVTMDQIPNKKQIRDVVPAHCFKRNTLKSMFYAVQSVAVTGLCVALGRMIPMRAASLPLWLAYAAVTGTAATGMWVVAHECGHGAFSDNRALQDAVGYILHTALLVPYFSWQHSHAVHHSRTNHITEGETHVPIVVGGTPGLETPGGEEELHRSRSIGGSIYGAYQLTTHLVFGWPVYLLFGATGGPKYGMSNHFWAKKPFSTTLWPNKWPKKVGQSALGCSAMLVALAAWASKAGAATVFALYGAPLMFTNMWLVLYTWLQHTDVDIPHLGDKEFSYMRGAFLTVDRPYGPIFDWLHHKIGSTHVTHHIDCTIPHYHAREATDAIAKNFPDVYLYDPTPVHVAMWRVAKNCIAVKRDGTGRYQWAAP